MLSKSENVRKCHRSENRLRFHYRFIIVVVFSDILIQLLYIIVLYLIIVNKCADTTKILFREIQSKSLF